jgi:flagellar hook-associated protein 1 FlgK
MVELSEGVDTDAELQKLLLIEQAYTANARVMQIADEMLKTLIGL